MTVKTNKRKFGLSDAQLLMFIAIGIFVVMYAGAMIFLGGAFLKTQQFFDLLAENAALIIVSCGLTIVMAAMRTPAARSDPRAHAHSSAAKAHERNVLALPSA